MNSAFSRSGLSCKCSLCLHHVSSIGPCLRARDCSHSAQCGNAHEFMRKPRRCEASSGWIGAIFRRRGSGRTMLYFTCDVPPCAGSGVHHCHRRRQTRSIHPMPADACPARQSNRSSVHRPGPGHPDFAVQGVCSATQIHVQVRFGRLPNSAVQKMWLLGCWHMLAYIIDEIWHGADICRRVR